MDVVGFLTALVNLAAAVILLVQARKPHKGKRKR